MALTERNATILPFTSTKDAVQNKSNDKKPSGLKALQTELYSFLKGKEGVADTLLSSILASGHVLIEDVPGVGKTTLVKALSKMLGLDMKRIQCTSDLMPTDITGVEVYNTEKAIFEFHQGPLFSSIVFADELNRASPRTQSALLEAMGEGSVSVNKHTYVLPKPFLFFASQNPKNHLGTYSLPESQLDRFCVRLELNYPDQQREKSIFQSAVLNPLENIQENILTKEELLNLQSETEKVFVSDSVADYVQRFVESTRNQPTVKLGISTRGGVSWVRVAKGQALLKGRNYLIPEDLLLVADYCLSHRLVVQSGNQSKNIIEKIISETSIG